jgi:hypothetical protein
MSHPSLADQHMARCRFFTGIQHETCKQGFRYDEVRDETRKALNRLPCFANGGDEPPCEKREFPSRAEAVEHERAANERFANVCIARAAIVDHTKKARGVDGVMPCPICADGQLRYSVAACNGHIHGSCTTPDCVSWME